MKIYISLPISGKDIEEVKLKARETAEVHDFNSRALSRMADMYYELIKREDKQ